MKGKKVLVVGGAGYIGGLTTDVLLSQGHVPTVYDNLLYEPRYLKKCNFIFGDVRATDRLKKLEKDFDEIIWLAAIVGEGACGQNPDLTVEVNLKSLDRFLSKAKRRVIFASTCSVYGAQDKLLDEASKANPLSLYATTKLEAEKLVVKHNGLVFRLGTIYGLGDLFSRIRLDLVVNILTLKAIKDGELTVFGGDQWRPIISVKDVAEYFAEAVTNQISGIYNLKYKNTKIVDLADEIKQVFPDVVINTTSMKFQDLRNYRVKSDKVEKDFDHVPTVDVIQEVRNLETIFVQKRIKDADDPVYYNTHYVKKLMEESKL